ncbi:NAD-dependent epimerase/dehydratase family protein [Agrococcus lahaulensis]|nr:NAD-dependent epimerase/dehydratase family protein [Agrococcus lahaulensis]
MKIVVTGGGGFIGTNLVQRLLLEDSVSEIVTFDDYSTGWRTDHGDPRVSAVEGDLRSLDAVSSVVAGAASVVHLGALPSVPRSIKDPQSSNAVNVDGTLNVLESARAHDVQHVVVASSSSVYGANPMLPKKEEFASRPLSPYAVTKLATESYANAYGHSFGMTTLAFRFFNVFGPLQRADHAYAAVIPKFLQAIRDGRALEVHGDGEQSRDFTSVHAVTDALTKAALRQLGSPDPVNLAFGTRTTLNELISMLQSWHDAPIVVEHVASRTGDVRHSQADSSSVQALIPDVQVPSFEDALREVYDWYLELPRAGAASRASEHGD